MGFLLCRGGKNNGSIFMDIIFISNRGIMLAKERWNHIIETHPEVKGMVKELEITVQDPDLIKKSLFSEDIVLFYRHSKHIFEGKHMCVVIRFDNNSIITAYITDRIKRGDVVWKKS